MVTGDRVRGCKTLPGKSDVMVSIETAGAHPPSGHSLDARCRPTQHLMGIKTNASHLEEKPSYTQESEVGLAGKYEYHPLPQTLGTCSQGNLSVC